MIKKGKHLNIYNIGTNQRIKIIELVNKLSKIFERKKIIKKTPLSKGGTTIRVPNINKIKKLGFKYKFSLDKGLKKMLQKN